MSAYSIHGTSVLKNRCNGKSDYICDLGENIFVSVDIEENIIIGHGSFCGVSRIIQTYNEYVKNSDIDSKVDINIEIVYLIASEKTVNILNNLINNIDYDQNFRQLLDLYQRAN